MKKTGSLLIAALFAAMIAACGGAVENKTANTNTNANTAGPAGPATVEALKALEVKAFEAYKNKDAKYFETFLDRNFVAYEKGKKIDRAEVIKMIGEHKDEIKGYTFSDEKLTKLGPVTAVLTMKAVTDGTSDGKKIPDVVSSTLFTRVGTDWRAAWHGEVPIVASNADDKAKTGDKAKAADTAKADTAAKTAPATADVARPAEKPKAEDKKPAEAKPADAKATDAKPAGNANSAAPAAINETDALFAIERSGWEAWKAKDWTKIGTLLTDDATFVDVTGKVTAGKDANVKNWTDTNCDVKSIAFSDQASVSVTGDTSILFVKATPTGTCGGEKLGPVWVVGIYVKDGPTGWKLGHHIESPA